MQDRCPHNVFWNGGSFADGRSPSMAQTTVRCPSPRYGPVFGPGFRHRSCARRRVERTSSLLSLPKDTAQNVARSTVSFSKGSTRPVCSQQHVDHCFVVVFAVGHDTVSALGLAWCGGHTTRQPRSWWSDGERCLEFVGDSEAKWRSRR